VDLSRFTLLTQVSLSICGSHAEFLNPNFREFVISRFELPKASQ
jgi:hypothetical protein